MKRNPFSLGIFTWIRFTNQFAIAKKGKFSKSCTKKVQSSALFHFTVKQLVDRKSLRFEQSEQKLSDPLEQSLALYFSIGKASTGCFLIVCIRCQPFLTSKTWTEIVRKSKVFTKRDATIFWAIRSLNPVLLSKVTALTTQILFLYAYRYFSKSRYFGVVFGWFSQNSRTYKKTEKGVVC